MRRGFKNKGLCGDLADWYEAELHLGKSFEQMAFKFLLNWVKQDASRRMWNPYGYIGCRQRAGGLRRSLESDRGSVSCIIPGLVIRLDRHWCFQMERCGDDPVFLSLNRMDPKFSYSPGDLFQWGIHLRIFRWEDLQDSIRKHYLNERDYRLGKAIAMLRQAESAQDSCLLAPLNLRVSDGLPEEFLELVRLRAAVWWLALALRQNEEK